MKTFIFFSALTLLASCGKGGGSSSSQSGSAIQDQKSEGSYLAILRPYNNSLSGFLPTGKAEIAIKDDNFSVKTYLDDDQRVSHMQSIHTGTRCPDKSDDRNGDGLIDIEESYRVVGPVLLPLDADVSSAEEGENIYPTGGGFTYSEQGPLSKIESDVRARTNQNLNLGGRVVLIHGVSSGTFLPASVKSTGLMPATASIPIACGILKRL
jgi:hypothetical protein